MLKEEIKETLEAVNGSIDTLSCLRFTKRKDFNNDSLNAISEGLTALEEKHDVLIAEAKMEIVDDISPEIVKVLQKIETEYLVENKGTTIPESNPKRAKVEDLETELTIALAELLLAEIVY